MSARKLAPVVLFAFRRPAHTRALLESLRNNPEASETTVYAFLDGPRTPSDVDPIAATHAAIRDSGLRDVRIVARERNFGLANNVIDGVSRVCGEHGRVVVLEDDLLLAPTYLAYMNDALDRYGCDERVFHVSGYMFPVRLEPRHDAVFLPMTTCSGGWATWSRAWRHFDARGGGYERVAADPALRRRFDLGGRYCFFHILEQQRAGKVDSWAIRWYLSVFLQGGLALFPVRSLAKNVGFGSDATHTTATAIPEALRAVAHPFHVQRFPEVALDEAALRRVSRFLGKEFAFPARVSRKVRRISEHLSRIVGRVRVQGLRRGGR